MAASAAGAVMQMAQQQDAVKAQNQQNEINRKAIADQQDRDRMEGERAAQQEFERAAAETNQYAKDANARMATLDALIGEGASGATADRKYAASSIATGQDLATLASNTTKQQASISQGVSSAVTRGSFQSASIRDSSAPSAVGAALQIGGSALKYGQQMDAIKNPKPK